MGHAEILAALPTLRPEERALVFERLCELQESDLLHGRGPTDAEREILDRALAEFEADRNVGRPWREVLRDIRSTGPTSKP